MTVLSLMTTLVNLVALLVALWLGLYLVTRSMRSQLAWLGALTLWSVGAWFLHNALQGSVSSRVWTDWLGQLMKLSLPLWFHLTCVLRFTIAPPRPLVRRIIGGVIILSYGLVAFQIMESGGLLGTPSPVAPPTPAVHFSHRWITSSFPLFLSLLVLLPLAAIVNLWESRRHTTHPVIRRQLHYLLLATVVAYGGGVYAGFAVLFRLDIPVFPADAVLGASVALLGYGVAGYSALLEDRPVGRDAYSSAVGLASVAAIYSIVSLLLYDSGRIDLSALVVILVVAVVTHALYDGGRAIVDRLFYNAGARQLRADLRQLAAEAGMGGTLEERLAPLLEEVRRRMKMPAACIAVKNDDGYVVRAASNGHWLNRRLPAAALHAVQLRTLEPGELPECPDTTLLVPLHVVSDQVGALLLGARPDGAPYAPVDLAVLETLADPLAVLCHTARVQETQAQVLDRALAEFRAREHLLEQQQQDLLSPQLSEFSPDDLDERELVALVEKALRRLHDYGFLGESPLLKLQVVQQEVAQQTAQPGEVATPVEQGKGLVRVLEQALEKLRPDGDLPNGYETPGREWYPYLILYQSYVLQEPTRDIMSRLYISEGTYNRTRRDALRSLAKTLQAMEQAVHQQAPVHP